MPKNPLSYDVMDGSTRIEYASPSLEHSQAFASFRMIRGLDQVLAQQPMLSNLAERCGQAGMMDQLGFYLLSSRERAKAPRLLLLSESPQYPAAAILLYEYCVAGIPTGVYMSADFSGQRSVLAPADRRCLIAAQAADFLIRRGALLALLTVADGESPPSKPGSLEALARGRHCAIQTRIVRRTMELKETYEATLAMMGHDTRRNFRRHTRKVDEEFAASFVTEPAISEKEFLALNRESAFPVATSTCCWRFRGARQLPNSIFVGLQARNGQWLSILGGRRQGDLTDVDWQLNRAGLHGYSLVTAMRAHLIQHEVCCGTHFLRFDGGTAHSMHLTFLQEKVRDLLLARRFLGKRFVTKLIPRVLPPDSLLGNVLRSKDLVWCC